EEQQALLVSVPLRLLRRDLPRAAALAVLGALGRRLVEVELVAAEGDDDAGGGLALELGDPVLGLYEGGGLREVVDDEGGLRVAVVHGGQGGEALLAGGVPYLELDCAGREVTFLCEESGCRVY